MPDEMQQLLQVEDLRLSFPAAEPGGDPHLVLDGVSLALERGEVLGLVGESGSGKTTLGKAVLRLYRPDSGRIVLEGRDIAPLGEAALRPLRRRMAMVFQDPLSSFNPRDRIGESVAVPLRLHRLVPRHELSAATGRLLRRVGLPESFADRFPHELSGGQLQRVAIARALSLSPGLVVADEPVSKLDVSVRAQILNLFRDMQRDTGVAVLFVTHDLRVARYLCDRVAVMLRGRIVEAGPSEEIFAHPTHEYTRKLLGVRHSHHWSPS